MNVPKLSSSLESKKCFTTQINIVKNQNFGLQNECLTWLVLNTGTVTIS